jgi:hypothetical protein
MLKHILRAIPLLAIPTGAACSLPMLLHENLDAIQASTAAIRSNSVTVERSADLTEAGIKSFEGLKAPMESMSELNPTLKAVAALDGPMTQVARLAPGMRAVADLREPMTDLAGLQPSLGATAALGPPMERLAAMRTSLEAVATLHDPMMKVAALGPQLSAVAELHGAMNDLSALKGPLEEVSRLREPMTRLAALAAVWDRPVPLVALALAGLGAWGLVTFMAVRLAILGVPDRGAMRR